MPSLDDLRAAYAVLERQAPPVDDLLRALPRALPEHADRRIRVRQRALVLTAACGTALLLLAALLFGQGQRADEPADTPAPAVETSTASLLKDSETALARQYISAMTAVDNGALGLVLPDTAAALFTQATLLLWQEDAAASPPVKHSTADLQISDIQFDQGKIASFAVGGLQVAAVVGRGAAETYRSSDGSVAVEVVCYRNLGPDGTSVVVSVDNSGSQPAAVALTGYRSPQADYPVAGEVTVPASTDQTREFPLGSISRGGTLTFGVVVAGSTSSFDTAVPAF